MGVIQSGPEESFQTGRNFILLYIGGNTLERNVYILPRTCPLYENIRGSKFILRITANYIFTSVMNADIGDVVVLVGTNTNIDLISDVQDGGIIIPCKLVHLLEMAQQKKYLAYTVTHLITDRDLELMERLLLGDTDNVLNSVENRVIPENLFTSLNKLKLEN